MNTTTKCQHAAVFTTLTILLIIIACVAFLAPVTNFRTNFVEPVTRIVTYTPSYHYDRDGRMYSPTTRPYGRDRARTTPNSGTASRSRGVTTTSRYGSNDRTTRYNRDNEYDQDYDNSRNSRNDNSRNSRDRSSDSSVGTSNRDRDNRENNYGVPTVGPNPNPNLRSDVPVAALSYPALSPAANSSSSNSRSDRHKRSSSSSSSNSNSHSQPTVSSSSGNGQGSGQISMDRNQSMPQGQQMMMTGSMSGLMPGQTYAVSMHQYGDMQNGCNNMGPAFNEGQYSMKQGMKNQGGSRHKRSVSTYIRRKRSNDHDGPSKKEQREMEDYAEDHNGSLMGFFMANETGNGNFTMAVPMAHQGACMECGGVMGRGVSVQPVHSMPNMKMMHGSGGNGMHMGGMNSPMGGSGGMGMGSGGMGMNNMGMGGMSNGGGMGGMGGGGMMSNQDKMVNQFMSKINKRKKRYIAPSPLSSSSSNLELGDNYHHKNPTSSGNGGSSNNMGSSTMGSMGDYSMNDMNGMAHNGTLNGTMMAEHMGEPVACGVFARYVIVSPGSGMQ